MILPIAQDIIMKGPAWHGYAMLGQYASIYSSDWVHQCNIKAGI